MDFSTLLSSGSLLYVGIGATVVLIVILTTSLFRGRSSASAPAVATSAAVSGASESQAVAEPTESLPSTEVVNQMPAVEQASTQPVQMPKGEVPPLSSWKPSQEAAPIPSNDDSIIPPSTIGESVSSAPPEKP